MSSVIIKNSRNTENAPKCAMSTQSVAFSHYNNIAAQLPIDTKSGKIVAGGVREQAAQCLNNIKAVVESTDHAMDDVIRVNVFLKNIKDIFHNLTTSQLLFPYKCSLLRIIHGPCFPDHRNFNLSRIA